MQILTIQITSKNWDFSYSLEQIKNQVKSWFTSWFNENKKEKYNFKIKECTS